MPQVLNTNANLESKTLLAAENADTITGLKTFDRDPSAPFAVTAASAVVPNLDADKVDGKDATALLLLDGTQAMTGALNLGAPGQIQFPAIQNPSGGANVLDDYEEGTFTPSLSFGGGSIGLTYGANRTGSYTKIGNLITVDVRIQLTAKGSSTGAAQITGCPFAFAGAPVGTMEFATGGALLTSAPFIVTTGSTLLPCHHGAAVRAQLTEVNFTDTSDIRLSITCRV